MNKIARFLSAHVLTLLLLLFPLSLFAQQLQVHFIDVSQGDAILITNPPNQAILIDAGDKPTGKTVVNYLKEHDVRKLSILIATHPDEDHIGGMADIVEGFPVTLYLDSGVEKPTQTSKDLNLLIKKKRITHRIARIGQCYNLKHGINLKILFPSEPLIDSPPQGTESNANSIVVKLTYNNVSFLLPGDAEETTEERLLEEQGAEVLSSTVLKVAYHGSRYTLFAVK